MMTNLKFNADAFLKWQKMQKDYFKEIGKLEDSKKDRQPFKDVTNIPQVGKSKQSNTSEKKFISPEESENSLKIDKRFNSFGKVNVKSRRRNSRHKPSS
jgi:hypothetical protein